VTLLLRSSNTAQMKSDRHVGRSQSKKCRPRWKGSPIGLKSRCQAKPLFPWFSISLDDVTYSEGPTLCLIAIVSPKLPRPETAERKLSLTATMTCKRRQDHL